MNFMNAGVALGIALLYGLLFYSVDRSVAERSRGATRWLLLAGGAALFFYALHKYVDDFSRAVDLTKVAIALLAASAVFYESQRAGARRPISERWKRFVGISLGIAAILAYFNGLRFDFPNYIHRHDVFHYYLGAKYFPEMGYDGLYAATAIAEDELGTVEWQNPAGKTIKLDLSKEVRHPDHKVRNLGGDNMLMPALTVLEHPEVYKAHFSPPRWESFKADVRFLRLSCALEKGYWDGMQTDHGYNPPPGWTILGRIFAELHPASTHFLQFLTSLDLFLTAGMFGALFWAFGWRVTAVAAVFWGTQASAPFYWNGAAFLRQDWLFLLVLSTCLLKKGYFKLAGAAFAYATLLRVFPGLVAIGFVVTVVASLVRKRALDPKHRDLILGGVLATAVLVPTSLVVAGRDSYQQFYEHTIKVHDQTPLTNHMGLRVLVAHKLGSGPQSGRAMFVKDDKLVDPFEVWKRMRNERYAHYRLVAYAVVAACLAFFVVAARRVRALWLVQCLAQVFIILLSQLTCYYYTFMILGAPLTKAKRSLEVPLFALAVITQFIALSIGWFDDRHAALTLVSLVFTLGVVGAFAPQTLWHRLGLRPKA